MKGLRLRYSITLPLVTWFAATSIVTVDAQVPAGSTRTLVDYVTELAESLERDESPIPFLRDALAQKATVDSELRAVRPGQTLAMGPDWFTESYVAELEAGWNQLNPHLNLNDFAQRVGVQVNRMLADERSFIAELLILHQSRIVDSVARDRATDTYAQVRADVLARLQGRSYLNHAADIEVGLSEDAKTTYRRFLSLDRFSRSDFDELDRFYSQSGGRDQLSEQGRLRMTQRVANGMNHNLPRAFATEQAQFSKVLLQLDALAGDVESVESAIDLGLPADQATRVRAWFRGMIDEVAQVAVLRAELGVVQWALDQASE